MDVSASNSAVFDNPFLNIVITYKTQKLVIKPSNLVYKKSNSYHKACL